MANTIEETRKRAGWFIDRLVYGSQITQQSHERTIKTLKYIDFYIKPLLYISGFLAIHDHFFRFLKPQAPITSRFVSAVGKAVCVGSLVGWFEISPLIDKYQTSANKYQKLIKKAQQFKEELETASVDDIESKLKEFNHKKALIGIQCVSLTPSWKGVQDDINERRLPLLQPERIDVMKQINTKFSEAEKKQRAKYFGEGSNLRMMLKNDKTVHYTAAEHVFWMRHASPYVMSAIPLIMNKAGMQSGFLAGIAIMGFYWVCPWFDSVVKNHLSAGSNLEKLWGETEIFLLSVDSKEGNPAELQTQLNTLKREESSLQTHSNSLTYPWPYTKEVIQKIVKNKLPPPKQDNAKHS